MFVTAVSHRMQFMRVAFFGFVPHTFYHAGRALGFHMVLTGLWLERV